MTNIARSKTAQEVLNEIKSHINSSPHASASWYVGITQDAEQRLFVEHNVQRTNSWWIYREANSSTHARDIEQALLNWGCDGGSGGGDSSAVYVYAYYKSANTRR